MNSFIRNISPRLVGLIAGFMWISYYVQNTVSLIVDYLDNLRIQEYNELGIAHYDSGTFVSITTADLIESAVFCIIAIIIGTGLIKNHPKKVIFGTACLIADGVFYLVQILLQEEELYIPFLLNLKPVIVPALMLFSLIAFRKGTAKIIFFVVTAAEVIFSVILFAESARVLYSAEDALEVFEGLLVAFGNSGFDTALLTVSLCFYILVLIFYEGIDIQENYDGKAMETYAYADMNKHLLLCFFTGPIWYFIWVYRTTKTVNEISGEYDKYKPGVTALKHLIPFYSFFWFFTQAERVGEQLFKKEEDEKKMGLVALLLHFTDTFAGMIYLQDKINEYCIKGEKKLRKKAKYDDYYDENYGITIDYPTDTTEKKATELFLEESPWDEE